MAGRGRELLERSQGRIPMAGGREPGDAEEPAGSETLLDTLLRNLYDLGETDDEQQRTRKKRENKKRDVEAAVAMPEEPLPPGSLMRGPRKSTSSFFKELKEELHGASMGTLPPPTPGPDIPAATAVESPAPQKTDSKQVEVVEFHSRSQKRKPKPDLDVGTKNKTNVLEKHVDIQEFNLEKARLEVHRFGITGYGKGKERVLERERAIMLGAKPPKNTYVNYKTLQEQIKAKKAAEEEERRMARDTDMFKRKKRKGQEDGKSKKKSAPSILSSGRIGQVGKFKNGTLILSPGDIKKISSSKVAK